MPTWLFAKYHEALAERIEKTYISCDPTLLRRVRAGIRRLKELCHELSTHRAFKVDFGTHVRSCCNRMFKTIALPYAI